jgi:hypothetical protein
MKPIFIFSLPRSGSTLLQRILATSSQISTVSEPWILLPYAYTIKANGVLSEYGHTLAFKAISDFYKRFPRGRKDYLDELSLFIMKLYEINSEPKSKYFLDKTPRYHLIFNEIAELFPDGKFIFLWRNPLGVVSSIINTWCKGKWKLSPWDIDLYAGISNLVNAFRENQFQVHALQYEKLITAPVIEVKKLCAYLEIEYDDRMLNLFTDIHFEGQMGDKIGIKKYDSLSDKSLSAWEKTFNNPFRRYWARRYLAWIGNEYLQIMGYNYSDLKMTVSNEKDLNINYMFSDWMRILFYKFRQYRYATECRLH